MGWSEAPPEGQFAGSRNYSCFISYSSKDEAFARKLHTRLQAENVRCWFAPEDLRLGDKFQKDEEIERSIRLYDKFLLILSENSVNNPRVEREVKTAFEKEQHQGSTVLLPICLDDTVMEASTAWAADIVP
jgi:hypothetical protein